MDLIGYEHERVRALSVYLAFVLAWVWFVRVFVENISHVSDRLFWLTRQQVCAVG